MKIKVTMILEIEDADSFEEAEEIFHEWDDMEFLDAVSEAKVTVEEVG